MIAAASCAQCAHDGRLTLSKAFKRRLRRDGNADFWFRLVKCLENGRKQRAKRRRIVTEPDAVDSDMGQVQSGMDIIANGNDGDDKDVEEEFDDEDAWAEGT